MDVALSQDRPITFEAPRLRDPRMTLAAALTLWTILGQTALYFNRDLWQLAAAVVTACVIDFAIALIRFRQVAVPLSAYITGLSIGILLESADWRIFVIASVWGIASKHLIQSGGRHFFNPSNFAIVAALCLTHGLASVAPGSQWGADFRIAMLIIALGLAMMYRVNRLDLVLAWMAGYVFMGLLRTAAGQGGLIFALGPMTGAEFALFSFSMLPDPKTSPATRNARILWGLSIAVCDGLLRYFEVRYSMFFSLFGHCALLPMLRRFAAPEELNARADSLSNSRLSPPNGALDSSVVPRALSAGNGTPATADRCPRTGADERARSPV